MQNLSDLHSFCHHLAGKFGSPDKASEEQKADEFRWYYLRDLPPSVKALRIVAHICGLKVHSSEELPDSMRGYNHIEDGADKIVLNDGDTVSGTQNTILHEIREIMERTFPAVCPGYRPLKTTAAHYAANRFAAAVLLPAGKFTELVYETGLDVITLADYYSKSCSQVLLRIGEVLQGKLFLYTAMYEPDTDGIWRVTYWTASANRGDPAGTIPGLDGFFPRKGRAAVPGSLVDLAIGEGKPHLVERVTFLNDREDGLVAIARPLIIQNSPSKVILTALLSRDRALLSPQIKNTRPVTLKRFHRHL
jgi:hypothetical protein